MMSCLPAPGKIECAVCHQSREVAFNKTITTSSDGKWRITANPLAWGNRNPAVVVLGFSKGTNAIAALNDPRATLDDIPYAQKRSWVAKILRGVQLLGSDDAEELERAIRSRSGLYHFGSLVRCTVEQKSLADGQEKWITSGNSMLEGFSAHAFGRSVLNNCIKTHLGSLPSSVKLVVLFGYGRNLGGPKRNQPDRFSYVENVREAMETALGEPLKRLNAVSYYTDRFVVLHVEHFSEPSNATHWLDNSHKRSLLRKLSLDAVRFALDR